MDDTTKEVSSSVKSVVNEIQEVINHLGSSLNHVKVDSPSATIAKTVSDNVVKPATDATLNAVANNTAVNAVTNNSAAVNDISDSLNGIKDNFQSQTDLINELDTEV